MRIGINTGKPKELNPIQRAIGILRRLTTSPSGIFVSGQGYLQTPGNLLLNSRTGAGGGFFFGCSAIATNRADPFGGLTARELQFTTGTSAQYIPTASAVDGLKTFAVWARSATSTPFQFRDYAAAQQTSGAFATTAQWQLFTWQVTSADTGNLGLEAIGATGSVIFSDTGVIAGAYTTAQILAMGGIPLTAAAAVAPVYTNASVYGAGSTQTVYGAELVTSFAGQAATYNGQSITEDGTTANHGVHALGATTADKAILVFDVAAGAKAWLWVYFNGVAGGSCWVNASTGSLGTIEAGVSATSFTNGDGSYRITITKNAANSSSFCAFFAVTANGSTATYAGTNGVDALTLRNVSIRQVITQSSVTNSLLSNNYTLSDGSTGYAAVDGPAGLVLDGMGTVGSELVTNGDGTSTTGWLNGTGVISVSGGEFVNTGTAAPYPEVFYDVSAVVGATYRIRIKVKRGTSANNAGWLIKRKDGLGNLTPIYSTASTSYVQYEAFVVAQDDKIRLSQVQDVGTGDTGTVLFDDVSIKQVTGIHATQATTANKPTERRGIFNQIARSNTFADASWVKTTLTLTTGIADPVGGTAATTLTATAASSGMYQNSAALTGYPAIWMRRRTGSGTIRMRSQAAGGAITVTPTSTWSLQVYPTVATGAFSVVIDILTSGDEIDVYGAGVLTAPLTESQVLAEGGIPLTTTAAASNPNAGRYSWSFDGGDSLALGSVPFQQSDDYCVIAAGSFAGGNIVNNVMASPSQGAVSTHRVGQVGYDASVNGVQCSWYDGTNYDNLTYSYPANTAFVGTAAKRSTLVLQRVNGLQRNSKTTTVALTSTRGSIGAYADVGGSNHNGNISIVIAIKGTLSDAEMLTLERFAASTLPNAPSF